MQFIQFQDVTFSYPPIEGDTDQDGTQITQQPIFDHCTAELPGGFVSLVGPNASGKSTLCFCPPEDLFRKKVKFFC